VSEPAEILRVTGLTGDAAVGFAVDAAGSEFAIALRRDLAAQLSAALRAGQRPVIEVESWQRLTDRPVDRHRRR
jgi:hypothetical protein